MIGLFYFACSFVGTLMLFGGLYSFLKNKVAEKKQLVERASKEAVIELKAVEEVAIPVAMKPKATTPELRAIWTFFEEFEKGNTAVKYSSECVQFNQGNVEIRFYDSSDGTCKYVFMYYNSQQCFDITYHVKQKEFRVFKDEMNLLDEADMSFFITYFQRIVHSPQVSKRQVDKATLANETVRTPKKATPHTPISAFSWEAYLKPLQMDALYPPLLETTVLLVEVIREKDYLEVEDVHRLERVEKSILPDLIQSYIKLSENERTLQQEAMHLSIEKIQNILNDLNNEARKEYISTFEKNVERINQLEA